MGGFYSFGNTINNQVFNIGLKTQIAQKRDRMEKTNQELLDEIRQLRNELRHMQEIVNSLVNIVMEMEDDIDEYDILPSSQSYLDMYN